MYCMFVCVFRNTKEEGATNSGLREDFTRKIPLKLGLKERLEFCELWMGKLYFLKKKQLMKNHGSQRGQRACGRHNNVPQNDHVPIPRTCE